MAIPSTFNRKSEDRSQRGQGYFDADVTGHEFSVIPEDGYYVSRWISHVTCEKDLNSGRPSHQTTTTSIVEQREIYRAILAIQKQSQGNSSSQAEQLSMDCSSDGTLRAVSPPSPPSHTDPRETISPGEETTLASTSLAGPAAALSSSPHVMAMPGLDMPDPFVLQTSKQEATNKNQSSRSIDSIGETRHDGMSSNSNQSSPGGNNTPKLNATVDNYREQRKVLEYFVIKPSIKDDTSQPGAISLTFWNNKIPMQQVDIRKQLFSSKEEDLQHVLDAYLELFDHEREVISYLIEDTKSHVSLMLLKRTYADMTYRGILFKGVPELQFILERVMDEDKEWIREARARTAITNMNEQMHGVASSKPTYLKVNRKHVSPETLDAYDLPWEWDDVSLSCECSTIVFSTSHLTTSNYIDMRSSTARFHLYRHQAMGQRGGPGQTIRAHPQIKGTEAVIRTCGTEEGQCEIEAGKGQESQTIQKTDKSIMDIR